MSIGPQRAQPKSLAAMRAEVAQTREYIEGRQVHEYIQDRVIPFPEDLDDIRQEIRDRETQK